MQIPLGRGAEFDLIRSFLAAADQPDAALPDHVRVGAGDDCAVVRGEGTALSVDMSVEGVHFRRDWLEPEEIGYRATAAALSDLAAMAATPFGVLASLALPLTDDAAYAGRIMQGARAAAAGARARLLGGDLARTSGPLVLDIVVIGHTLRPVLRRGARPGDRLWVTGQLGAAAAAVRSWKVGRTPDPAARLAYAVPMPRTTEAAWLAARGTLHALIDLSDGLAGDATHLAAASEVRIVLDAAAVPIHPAVHAVAADGGDALRLALSGGEDYELCFAAAPDTVEHMADAFARTFALPLTCVGTIEEGRGVALRDAAGASAELELGGYDHFAAGAGPA